MSTTREKQTTAPTPTDGSPTDGSPADEWLYEPPAFKVARKRDPADIPQDPIPAIAGDIFESFSIMALHIPPATSSPAGVMDPLLAGLEELRSQAFRPRPRTAHNLQLDDTGLNPFTFTAPTTVTAAEKALIISHLDVFLTVADAPENTPPG